MKLTTSSSCPNEMWISTFNFRDATTARMARTTPPEIHDMQKNKSTHTQQHQRIQQIISHMPATNRNCLHSTKQHPNKHFRPTGANWLWQLCVCVCVRAITITKPLNKTKQWHNYDNHNRKNSNNNQNHNHNNNNNNHNNIHHNDNDDDGDDENHTHKPTNIIVRIAITKCIQTYNNTHTNTHKC